MRCRRGARGKRCGAGGSLPRCRDGYGHWPWSVGLSVWSTSAMRTIGDDIAEALALLNV
jgi:cobaltochelatase CobN